MSYSPEQRAEAVDLYEKLGTAEAARRTGISATSIKRWAREAGKMDRADPEKTAQARAVAAERVTTAWADYRDREATAAGATAAHLRRQVVEASDAGNHQLLRARTIAYGIMIDKAELLSGNATERIETWAESEVDRELREAIAAMEEKIRESG